MTEKREPSRGADITVSTPLGKSSDYVDTYSPQLLCPIPRLVSRQLLGLDAVSLPFFGGDIWNAYELSWLNSNGKPVVALAQFYVPCDSENIVESKSFKLYLNSFNQTRFDSVEKLAETLIKDISSAVGKRIELKILPVQQWHTQQLETLPGWCLDDLDIVVERYTPDPQLLYCSAAADAPVAERLFTHLFRSLCPVTGQPDWASVHISYRGKAIDRAGLLAYLVGFRQHQDFHEQCVERIFVDILANCKPSELTVCANFVRRGGLDINPYRSTIKAFTPFQKGSEHQFIRLARQ